MEQWSILSNIVNYIQYHKHPKNFHNLNIWAVNKEKYKIKSNAENEERQMLELDFGDTPEKLKEEYLDVYEGIQSEILSTTRFEWEFRLEHNIFRKSKPQLKQVITSWKNHSQYQNKGIQ